MNLLAQRLEIPSDGPDGNVIINGPVPGIANIGGLIQAMMPVVIAVLGFGLLLMIISAGYGLLTSAGDPKKLSMARARLTYAVVGFLIVFSAYWIVQLFGIIFGIDAIKETFL